MPEILSSISSGKRQGYYQTNLLSCISEVKYFGTTGLLKMGEGIFAFV